MFMCGGPARRRASRPISSDLAEWFGVATIRNAGSIARVRRFASVRLRREMLAVAAFRQRRVTVAIFTTWLMVMLLPAAWRIAFLVEGWEVAVFAFWVNSSTDERTCCR